MYPNSCQIRLSMLILLTILGGCASQRMLTNDEIIKTMQFCKDSHLDSRIWWNEGNAITRIQCEPYGIIK